MKKGISNFLPILALEVIWPFGGLLLSFKKGFRDYSTLIYILFSAFFGYAYTPSAESDMVRYIDDFVRISQLDLNIIINEIGVGSFSDYYIVILSYTVSSFTNNPHVYLAVASLIYAFFYFNCVKLIIQQFPLPETIYSKLLVFVLYFYVPIFFINGLRFYTGFWVFSYSVIQIFFLGNKKCYFLLLLTPFIHFSFIASTLFFLLFSLLGRLRIFAYLILAGSIISPASTLNFSLLRGGTQAQDKILNYTNIELSQDFYENLSDIHSNSTQQFRVFEVISEYYFYFVLAFFAIILLSKHTILRTFDEEAPKLVNLNMFFLSMVFFTEGIPEAYRFKQIFVFIFYISLVLVFERMRSSSLFLFSFIFSSLGVILYIISNLYLNIKNIPLEFYFANWVV
jgi:hypothetical protein